MTPEEKLAAAGLGDLEPVTPEEWEGLPPHKRAAVTVFARVPDPAPVAALREVLRVTDGPLMERDEDDLRVTIAEVARTASEALSEFDGTTT